MSRRASASGKRGCILSDELFPELDSPPPALVTARAKLDALSKELDAAESWADDTGEPVPNSLLREHARAIREVHRLETQTVRQLK